MEFIEVDSKKIYIEIYGKRNKNTIVYFHGGPGASCLDFSKQAQALGEKYHVLSFDQYGVMRSDPIPEMEPFGMNDHVKLIDKLREVLGITSWTVLGHSYGGMLACLYAYTYPQSTDAVIYDCPSWNYILSAKTIASFFMPYFENINSEIGLNKCRTVIDKIYSERSEVLGDLMTILNMVADPKERNYLHGITFEEYQPYQQHENIPENGWKKSNIHMQKLIDAGEIFNNYLSFLDKINKPSLLLVGKYDPACGIDQREYFQKHSIQGTMVEFQNSGHFPRVEEPQIYTKSIINFMDCIH